MIILTDVDHTVGNSFWRDPMIGAEPWDTYHAAAKDDKPYPNVVSLINSLSSVGHKIIGITGRTEKFRQLTLNWFIKYHIDIDEILMRPDDLFLKNAEMKVKLVQDRFKNLKDIAFLIDDNEDTIIEFFKLGITTLQIRNIA
jgi:uncharacterized HAD superfamily protein